MKYLLRFERQFRARLLSYARRRRTRVSGQRLAGQLVGRLGFRYGRIASESRLDDEGGKTEGRLKGYNLVVAELLESVEKNAVGPWIRPVANFFESGASQVERIIPCGGGSVEGLALSNDDEFVYSGSEDGVVQKHYLKSGRLVAELQGHAG